ncbi:heme peroxidase [Lojkania enalia]|uniref:Peroxidase n=1 Tax=Lojkania enalia TaxID=147567 RepID=A0A9P4K174_9PLEO|nr:heme peroxidase [Didymosphaeria enalia]
MRTKISMITTLCMAATIDAFPGMGNTLQALSSIVKRQEIPKTELLADLKILPDSELTPVGKAIKAILQINRTAGPPQDFDTVYTVPGPLGSPECKAETCCMWKYVADEMATVFKGPSGRCTDLARGVVRLGFHDAGTWSKTAGGGGADGSFILAQEIMRPDNRGLENITNVMEDWYNKWHKHGAGMADLIQMGATIAAVSCPLGPRIRSFVGRNDSSIPSPEGRLPETNQDAEALIALFEDKTIVQGELISLLGAHTVSQQRFEDPSRAGDPQDSTPGVWDVKFYPETTSDHTPQRVFKFKSDVTMAEHPRSQELWTLFSDPERGPGAWAQVTYIRLSILGVEHINNLVECTGVLPLRVSNFTSTDETELESFLESKSAPMSEEAVKLLEGEVL